MKYLSVFIVVGLLFLMVVPVNAESFIKTDKQAKKIAEPIIDNILNGFRADDYAIYSRDFAPALKVAGARNKFYEINRYVQNSLGRYLYREYLGSLRKGETIVVLWKGVFDKSKDDILIKLMLSKKSGRYMVTGLWLQ